MTIDRLRTILSAYGANPKRWPAAERAAAEALLSRSPEARGALEEARALDATLDRATLPIPRFDPIALAAAISATPQARRQSARRRGGWLGWTPLAGLVAAGVAGLVIGLSGLAPSPSVAASVEPPASIFSQDVDQPW